ncbi:hypothetical protein Y958_24900 [Nitrospirillum viridazoti CBAmc]|uniref:Uncharacterized protein n=2 Tax=Nitrospirillum TaxID=1543705 RepID=A0A248K208_9PROT|nr:hypothetical protein Y958_24900 [Nitrospirillum amazonense CBAmc]
MADYWHVECCVGGQTLSKLHKELADKCPDFRLIRDVADASKHAKLLLQHKTLPRSLSSSDQVTIPEGLFTAPFGTGVFAEAAEITVELNDGTKESLIQAINSTLGMWDSILAAR